MAPPPPPPPTFTGCWLSGGVGYGLFDQETTQFDNAFGDQNGTPFGLLTSTFDTGGRGWLGRVGGGCDYQFGGGYGGGGLFGGQGFVIGAFADYDWTNLSGTFNDPWFGLQGRETMSNQWAIGGRFGWVPIPGLLTFVSGGYTEAHFNAINPLVTAFPTFDGEPLVGNFIDSQTYHGWFIGGGEEYAFNWLPVPGLFWKTEYRFSEFDRKGVLEHFSDGDIALINSNKKFVQTITTSLVWRFNWGLGKAPVAAAY
jgi:outer membrane immunogenic protein